MEEVCKHGRVIESWWRDGIKEEGMESKKKGWKCERSLKEGMEALGEG